MKRVLVVEPHPQVLDAISDLVEEEPGLELAGVAGTAREAISLAREFCPDVVLIDADDLNWRMQRLDRQLGELLPMALLVRIFAATDPEKECLTSPPVAPLSIFKTDAPEFLRSLTA